MTAAQKLRAAREGMTLFATAESPERAIEMFRRVAADLRSASEKMGAEAKARVRGTPNAKIKALAVQAWIDSKRGEPGDLLNWLWSVRNDDLHSVARDGGPKLVTGGGIHIESLEIGPLGEGLLTIGTDGVRFHRNVGTPEETSEAYSGGSWRAAWQLIVDNPPTTHRGAAVDVHRASEVLDLAYQAIRADWDEAEEFGR